MRKILFAFAIIVLLIFTGTVMYKGTNFAGFDIWGITQISQKNDDIDNENANLGKLVDTTYPAAISKLNTDVETLQQTKKEYEDQAILLADSKYYKQTETYKVEFLWTRIGNYAKKNNVILDLTATNSTASGLYDLNFTANGRYADVAQFIYNIENDSRLAFKIEDFSMVSAATTTSTGEILTNTVQGKFTCKEVRIDIKSLDTANTTNTTTNNNTTSENKTDTQNKNTTNATNSTNTANTTNNTNTTNTTGTTNTSNTNSNTTTDETQDMINEARATEGNTAQ